MIDVTEIEKRVDKAIAAPTPVDLDLGGVRLENLGQVMEFSKLMAVSGVAVPPWLRQNVGGCLAICSRAMRWGLDPFAVAEQSYLARGKGGEDHVAFMSQLIHAVITAHAPLKGRLRTEIIGQGDERRCKVWGTFKGESKPHEYISETLGSKVKAIGRNDKGQVKGSPLWDSDPEVQLRYSAVRQWCRLHSSETILGIYAPDELEDAPESTISSLSQRLRDAKVAHVDGRGFDPAHVARVIEGDATEANDENDPDGRTDQTGDRRRTVDAEARPGRDHDQKPGIARGQKPQAPGAHVTRQQVARKEARTEADLFEADRRTGKSSKGVQPSTKGKR